MGLAARWLTMCAAIAAGACTYRPVTTVKVRDPSAVRVDVDQGRGDSTLVPPGAERADAPLPATEPPFTDPLTPATSIRREAGGALEIRCDSCAADVQSLATADGTMVFGAGANDLRIIELDWTQREMKIRFHALQEEGPVGASFDAAVATPWDNVVSVRKVSTPDRGLGVKLLLSGAIGELLGVLAVIDGARNHHGASTAFGIPIIGISAALLAGGGWYALAPERTQTLYGGTTK